MTQVLPHDLIYTSDEEAGFSRRGAGRGFAYYDVSGNLIRDKSVRARLNSLAVPPAYQDVWLCAKANGHLQATGIDERGRKQYRYHERWAQWRNQKKFDSLLGFSNLLPRVRLAVRRDFDPESLSKASVLAAMVKLLDKTAMRVGSDTYLRENGTAGLTTLRGDDVAVKEGNLRLDFTAKGGEIRVFDLYLPTLAKMMDGLEDLPGQRLFQYTVNGSVHAITSTDVNDWLKENSQADISAKDFRTWRASCLTINHLLQFDEVSAQGQRVDQQNEALKATSEALGHRPPVCKKHYVHPLILRYHSAGSLRTKLKPVARLKGLRDGENTLRTFLINSQSLTTA